MGPWNRISVPLIVESRTGQTDVRDRERCKTTSLLSNPFIPRGPDDRCHVERVEIRMVVSDRVKLGAKVLPVVGRRVERRFIAG